MIDYQASYPKVSQCSTCPVNATVATYQMNYGEGKIINLGIWGHKIEENKVFLNYLDNVIIPLALGPAIKSIYIKYQIILQILRLQIVCNIFRSLAAE